MKIYTKWSDLRNEASGMAVALGMFDGVHRGHQSIIRRAVELAKKTGKKSAVFSFSNHPLSVLAPASLPPQIGDTKLKELLLGRLGVDIFLCLPFTKKLAREKPEDFLLHLKQYFAPSYVVTGPNFTFGSKGKGTHRMLMRVAEDYVFRAEICPVVMEDGAPVSSTRIRSLLAAGNLALANNFLGYPFTVLGRVIHGDRRGRLLGFPTANLAIPDERVMLPNGVYAAEAVLGQVHYNALANIGTNPTFTGCNRRLEVNLQDFTGDIYDRLLEVRFLGNLRDEKKFASVDELVRQMKRDREKAKKIWTRL